MGFFSIVVPRATTNLGDNPSAEKNANRYTAVGTATVARDKTRARFGRWSIKVDTAAASDGVNYYSAGSPISASPLSDYAITLSIWNNTGQILTATVYDQTPTQLDQVALSPAAKWQEVQLDPTTLAGSSGIWIQITGPTSGISFWLDGIQVEAAPRTTYCDGDQSDCRWEGVEHGSQSTREAFGQGGEELDLEDLEVYVEDMSGMGMPTVEQFTQGLGILPGELLESSKIHPRSASLTLYVLGDTLADMHADRQGMINTIKPDRAKRDQPFGLVYRGAGDPVRTYMTYDDGLQGTPITGFDERFILQLFGPDPFWYEDSQENADIGVRQSFATDYIMRRKDGQWGWPTTGGNGTVRVIKRGPDGTIYIGGSFTSMGGISNTARACKLINGEILPLATGIDDGVIYDFAFTPTGKVLVVGTYTTINAVTHNRIALYDPETDSFSTIGSGPGLDGAVYAAEVGLDGHYFFGGAFTDIAGGGGGTYNRIVEFDPVGISFSALGTGLNGDCLDLAIHPNSNLFGVGAFTTADGGTANYAFQWDGSAFIDISVQSPGDEFNATARGIAISEDGIVYVVGDFTDGSGNSCNYAAAWKGGNWYPLGSGLGSAAQKCAIIDDDLWVVGGFTTAGGISVPGITFWNGNIWIAPDLGSLGSTIGYAIEGDGKDIYIGHDSSIATAYCGAKITAINGGSAAARPVITFTGPGRLVWIENLSTGDRLYFNQEANAGEEISIDTRIGSRSMRSTWRRAAMLPRRSSNFGTFRLLPGSNDLVAFVDAATGVSDLDAYWTPTHWALDGVAA